MLSLNYRRRLLFFFETVRFVKKLWQKKAIDLRLVNSSYVSFWWFDMNLIINRFGGGLYSQVIEKMISTSNRNKKGKKNIGTIRAGHYIICAWSLISELV